LIFIVLTLDNNMLDEVVLPPFVGALE